MDKLKLEEIARVEFGDIVGNVILIGRKLRINIKSDGFLDAWHSGDERGRYKYHWVKDETAGEIYRHDNAPDARWKDLKTFPKHFHESREDKVVESDISDKPEEALRELLGFIRENL